MTCTLEAWAGRGSRGSAKQFARKALFFSVPAGLGMIPGGLTFALNPNAAADIGLNVVPVPAWFFVPLWVVIHGCMGLAVREVFLTHTEDNRCIPVAILLAGFVQTELFWLTDSLRNTAITDATGLLLATTTFWIFTQYSRRAAMWLLPWLLWMPVTLAIKVMLLAGLPG